jgi:hypothetical protein
MNEAIRPDDYIKRRHGALTILMTVEVGMQSQNPKNRIDLQVV